MDTITASFPFYRSILTCLPDPVLNFFYAILGVFVTIIFVKMIINLLG